MTLLLSSCALIGAGPARTNAVYRAKATKAAEQVVSSLHTAGLGVQLARDGKATAPYLSVLVGDSEESAGAAHHAFDRVQSPSDESDQLQEQLDALLTQADSTLSQVRTSVRRGELDQLDQYASDIQDTAGKLQDFEDANQ